MAEYLRRLVDSELDELMSQFLAIALEGSGLIVARTG